MKRIQNRILLLLLCATSSVAQENDFQIWTSASANDRVTYKTDINIKHAQKNAAHRAEADVYESINELRFYRDTIFAQSS